MKLIIRNTSRDRSTTALRKARPGAVQPNPTIKKVRLPPGGTLSIKHQDLQDAEVRLISKLIGCGCLKAYSIGASGPMQEISAEGIMSLCEVEPEKQATVPTAAPKLSVQEQPKLQNTQPRPEPEPEPAPTKIVEDWEKFVPEEVAKPPPFLKDELLAMTNADLRDILSGKNYGRTTGMNKAALADAILETQES
jgi:hypothetical protein